jgi:hypothetical protein
MQAAADLKYPDFGTIPLPSQATLKILKELRQLLENTPFKISKQIS